MEFILNFLPVIADHSYDLATGTLKIDIVGVGSSPSDWLDTFIFWLRFILATVVGMLAAFGIEYVFKVFRGEIVHGSRKDSRLR
tara:strand:+ start:354 stop:605 length:252 start_codon:yes stop_codon:yes gene_type:complete